MSTIIIAEAGVNHNGDMLLAKEMIEKAAEAGADIVKFQTFVPELVISKFASKADYQKNTTGTDESQLDMVRRYFLSNDEHYELVSHAKKCGIEFLSTPFDLVSVDFLKELDLSYWKIPSGEITNLPYLIAVAKTGKPVIMSSGMCTMEEVKSSLNVLKENGSGEIIVLHCNTEYPTPFEDANLSAIITLRDELGVRTGYSDHTPGIEAAIAATALGAVVLEKHFTLDRNMDGPDHKASIEPDELIAMVQAVRNVERAMGTGIKSPSPSERKNIDIARKSIVARVDIQKGEVLTEDNIIVKRPGDGISPMKWFDVLGTKAIRDFSEDEKIEIV